MIVNQFSGKKVFTLVSLSLVFFLNNGCSKSSLKQEDSLASNNISQAPANTSGLRKINLPEFIIDQSNTTSSHLNAYNNKYWAPLGQEFTPKLHALDAVDLRFADASCSLAGSDGGDMKVQIREGTIAGTIIGTSATLHFSNCFNGTMRFDFPGFVQVTPGNVYIIEPVYASGHTAVVVLDDGPGSLYPGGNLILGGVVEADKDMWFEEGLYNSVARTKDQVKQVGWENLVRRDGTTFRNNGECMKYIEGN